MLVVESFADIPAEVQRRVGAGERVILILLDAFGLEFLQRHRDHPLIQRLNVTPVMSQFPSTTTAHVSSVHFGMPVHEHGLYEWNILEPALGEIICPLRFNASGAEEEGTLVGRLEPSVLAPGPTFYESMAVPCVVAQPFRLAGSFSAVATRGARVIGFRRLREGVHALGVAFAAAGSDHRYAFLYWDLIDRAGHDHGPGSPEFADACRRSLDELWDAVEALRGVTVLITADHGQVDVGPDRVDYLDDLWPELSTLLSQPRPAGSSRDVFLHVHAEHVLTVIHELSVRLEGRAEVRAAGELFDRIGPRLKARLGDVAVLPAAGRQAWLRSAAANEQRFRGQHGGLHEAETSTYLATLMD
ncbi:MAG TPA: alkaline phosphatase family protein [Solirubrobacteraceae bacterium]|nr:alkaline phosphatase family protein [Solirubrobacteraceae bacterium]